MKAFSTSSTLELRQSQFAYILTRIWNLLLGKAEAITVTGIFSLSEDIGPFVELMLAKILLRFGADQPTCRDDDEHMMSQLFKSKKDKDLLCRMEPQLLMCVFNG